MWSSDAEPEVEPASESSSRGMATEHLSTANTRTGANAREMDPKSATVAAAPVDSGEPKHA